MRKYLPIIIICIVMFFVSIVDSLPNWALLVVGVFAVAGIFLMEVEKIPVNNRRRIPPRL